MTVAQLHELLDLWGHPEDQVYFVSDGDYTYWDDIPIIVKGCEKDNDEVYGVSVGRVEYLHSGKILLS